MKKFFLIFIFFPLLSSAQVITTFAGGGAVLGDGGPATAAFIDDPGGMTFDKNGNLYIACGTANRVRKIDTFGIITTVAGTGVGGYSGDGGTATNAKLKFPNEIAIDASGNLFIADCLNHAIRKIDIITGIITTICGNGTMGADGDGGLATAARIYGPNGISFDKAGNLYIADCNNNRVRKINTSGIISTFAGTGVAAYNGDGIAATSAQLYLPITMQEDDAGNIYISDQGNYRIRKVNTAGIISTYAGNGGTAYSGDGLPAINAQFTPNYIKFGLDKSLYLSGNRRVAKIDNAGIFHTTSGDGTATNSGDGGAAAAASLYEPMGVALDKCDNLYISLINYNRIRKVTYNPSPCLHLEVNEQVPNEQLSIYPNPTNDELHIDNLQSIAGYTIQNIIGQAIQQGTLRQGNNSIGMQHIGSGIYTLIIAGEDNKRTAHKIVKQ